MRVFATLITFTSVLLLLAMNCAAQETAPGSPKRGWNGFDENSPDDDISEVQEQESSGLRRALLWIPNRLLDLLDVVHLDVGVGPALGGVVRITKYGQAGYRQMMPASLRAGLFGRSSPIKIETSNEIGIGPAFAESSSREICSGEIGVGLDLLIAGGYAGICLDEVFDFLGGIFLFDTKDDDFK